MPILSTDAPRVGIELEGVGCVTTRWQGDGSVTKQKDFHEIFKKVPLVKSQSFKGTDGATGSYITMEDSDNFGKDGPAELVTAPYEFVPLELVRMRNSIWKFLRGPRRPLTGTGTVETAKKEDDFSARFGRNNRFVKVSGSLQTSVGVGVHKLLSGKKSERDACIDLLAGAKVKRQALKDLATCAVATQQWMSAQSGAAQNMTGVQVEGLRLAAFMGLINFAVVRGNLNASAGMWAKDRLGANPKGGSSWEECGVSKNRQFFKAATMGKQNNRTVKDVDLINVLLKAVNKCPVFDEIFLTVREKDNDGAGTTLIDQIGASDNALSTDMEGTAIIDNFTYKNHLYTVIECREGHIAPLNLMMAEFLNGKPQIVDLDNNNTDLNSALIQARGFVGKSRPLVGA